MSRCYLHNFNPTLEGQQCPGCLRLGFLTEPPAAIPSPDARDTQVGGTHYKGFAIQPIEYIHSNNIPFIEGCVIKYVSRWRDKGGVQDIDKAIHFLQLLKEFECAKK